MMKLYITFVLLAAIQRTHICSAQKDDDKPNIVIVYTDEHNLRTLGSYRALMDDAQAHIWGPDVKVDTPNIDSIAEDGALFTNFYTASPLCTPSRGTFMTGTYPSLNGADKNDARMNDDAVTFAQVLQQELGYYTGYIGKVCMYACSLRIPCTRFAMCIHSIFVQTVASQWRIEKRDRIWCS